MVIGMESVIQYAYLVVMVATVIYASLTFLLLREQRIERNKIRFQEIADVLIFPLIEKLDDDEKYLKKGEVVWCQIENQTSSLRHPTKLIPISDPSYGRSDPSYRRTKIVYGDFKKQSPKIAEKIEKHDKEVEKLKEIIDKFADNIRSLPDFEKKVSEKFEEYKRVASSSDTSYFEPKTRYLPYILGLIVSNQRELRELYVYHGFWSQHGKGLLEFRERPELKNYKIDIETRCENLLELTDKLLEDLEAVVNKYIKKYGISTEELLQHGYIED